jgi:hypothetical protein
MERIISIKESAPIVFDEDDQRRGRLDGYEIVTSRQVIKIGVTNDQSCCESWGYLMSEDNVEEFIGSNLLDVKIVDTALNERCHVDTDEGDTMFVNLYTTAGLLQFVVYNCHNGYYGHTAIVLSEQIDHSESI